MHSCESTVLPTTSARLEKAGKAGNRAILVVVKVSSRSSRIGLLHVGGASCTCTDLDEKQMFCGLYLKYMHFCFNPSHICL